MLCTSRQDISCEQWWLQVGSIEQNLSFQKMLNSDICSCHQGKTPNIDLGAGGVNLLGRASDMSATYLQRPIGCKVARLGSRSETAVISINIYLKLIKIKFSVG